jgi:hypothetical protein
MAIGIVKHILLNQFILFIFQNRAVWLQMKPFHLIHFWDSKSQVNLAQQQLVGALYVVIPLQQLAKLNDSAISSDIYLWVWFHFDIGGTTTVKLHNQIQYPKNHSHVFQNAKGFLSLFHHCNRLLYGRLKNIPAPYNKLRFPFVLFLHYCGPV